jgi:hypothetical protein
MKIRHTPAHFPQLRDARLHGLRLARRWLHDTWRWLDTRLGHATRIPSTPADTPAPIVVDPLAVRAGRGDLGDASPTHLDWPETGHTRRYDNRQADLIRQGYNIGPACYGYQLQRTTLVDHQGRLRHRSRLVPDPDQASVVTQIFSMRAVTRLTVDEITRRLQLDHHRYPPPPARRPDRTTYWRAQTVERILFNPHYTGYQVLGYRRADGALAPREQWVISQQPAHRALVSEDTFWVAQNPTPEAVRALRHRLLAEQGPHRCA